MQNPKLSHWEVVCRILRYLKGYIGKGLVLKPANNLDIVGYSDANWAGDNLDRRSVLGFYVFVGGNLVSWKSKKQTLLLDQVQRLSIEQWLIQHVSCYG